MLGTHDAAMYVEPSDVDIAKTQVADFTGQLNRGVRWFDTRIVRLDASFLEPDGKTSCPAVTGAILPYPGPGYYLYGHGPDRCTGITLPTVLDQISQWLDQHPKEIVILDLVGSQYRINTPGYSYTVPDVNDVNSEFAFLAVFDQHLRRASDNASYIYDRPTACALAGYQYTSTGLYQGACQGPLIHPQEVTPQQLWTTSARVILLEQFSLDASLPTGIFPQFTWNDILYQASQEAPNERLTGSFSSGTIDPRLLFSRLENGSVADNDNLGLYGYRPAYQGYESDDKFLTLQAELTPNGVGIDGQTAAYGPIEDAGVFNPMLNSALQTTWQPYSINIVSIDDADDEGVLNNVINYNLQTFGRVQAGPLPPENVVAGRNGQLYEVAGNSIWIRTGYNGQPTDWTPTNIPAQDLAVDPSGNIWSVEYNAPFVAFNGNPGVVIINDAISYFGFSNLAADGYGNVYAIGNDYNPYLLTQSGGVIYGTQIPGIQKRLVGITVGPANTVTAFDSSGNIWQTTNYRNWTQIAAQFPAQAITADDNGALWATSSSDGGVWKYSGGSWNQYRGTGVQISVGPVAANRAYNMDVVNVLSPGSGVHNFQYTLGTGLGAQQAPPRRYAATVTVSGLTYSHTTKLFTGTLTVTNNTVTPITDQLAVVFRGLSPGVTVANNPLTYQDLPFVAMPTVTLQPGASTSTEVQFSDPNLVNINYSTEVFAYVAGS